MSLNMSLAINKRLVDALRSFESSPHMGGASPVRTRAESEAARAAIRNVGEYNRRYFNMAVGMLCVLFLGSFGLVLYFLNQPQAVAAIFAATGISFTWIFSKMIAAWKEKVNSDLLLAAAATLPPEELRSFALALLKQWAGQDEPDTVKDR